MELAVISKLNNKKKRMRNFWNEKTIQNQQN